MFVSFNAYLDINTYSLQMKLFFHIFNLLIILIIVVLHDDALWYLNKKLYVLKNFNSYRNLFN